MPKYSPLFAGGLLAATAAASPASASGPMDPAAIDRAVNQPIAINRRIEQEFGAEALLQFTEKLNRIIALCDEESTVEAEG